jgi:SAM-dependent methyltransferase
VSRGVAAQASTIARLRVGRISDAEFDDAYPASVRALSTSFWTPIPVAARAAALLVQDTSTRVLDVGSGAGKFCIVGAAITGAKFVGVEHRGHLIDTARAAAAHVGVTSAAFVHGTFDTIDVTAFDAIYVFNPFEENVWPRCGQIDDSVPLSRGRYIADVARMERLLERTRVGTRVVMYYGFGGEMPSAYYLALQDQRYSGPLELWIRGDDPPARARNTVGRRLSG